MPTYVYACQACREVIERRQSFHDDPLTVCEECGGELRRVIQPVGIIFNRASPPAAEIEAAKAPVATAEAPAPSSSTETAVATSPSAGAAPAAPASESAPAKDGAGGPTKPAPAPAKEPAAKHAEPATKPAAASEPKRPPDDGHRPAQR